MIGLSLLRQGKAGRLVSNRFKSFSKVVTLLLLSNVIEFNYIFTKFA